MASLIPKEFIDDLLARSSIEQIIDSAIHLKRSGKNLTACCPFHDEKTPSFTVSAEKQFYYCFGCGAHGNVISFLVNFYKISFVDAVQRLASTLGLTVPQENQQDSAQRQQSAPLYGVMEQAQAFFHTQLSHPTTNSAALNYLVKRGLTADIIRQFGVGYAPPGWNNLVDHFQSTHVPAKLAEQAGLITHKDDQHHYDRFRDRIMFPIRDQRGRVIAFGGRVVQPDAKPKYLNSPETPIFKKNQTLYGLFEAQQNTSSLQRLLIVEGYLDVIALTQAGIPYSVATLGTSISHTHVELLFRHVNQIIFCFDGDEAGSKAAFRALEASLPIMQDGRQVQFLWLPEGEDPDSLVRKEGTAAFQQRIERAANMADYLFEHLCESIPLNTLEGKAKLAQRAKPLIAQIPKGVFQQLIWQQLANITQLDIAQLQNAMTNISHNSNTSTESYPRTSQQPTKKHSFRSPLLSSHKTTLNLVDSMIRMLLQEPKLAHQVTHVTELHAIQLPNISLLLELIELIHQNPELSTAYLLGHWHNTQQGEQIARLAAQEFILQGTDQTIAFGDALHRLKEIQVQQQLEAELQSTQPDPIKVKQLLTQQISMQTQT